MDATRIDSLARNLAASSPRRRALATALGGALGLIGLENLAAVAGKSAKKCQGRKGRKKRKCRDRTRPAECRKDADCPEKTESCQGGRCRPVCARGVCPDSCGFCVVSFGADGSRSPVCALSFAVEETLSCRTPADCPNENPCLLRTFPPTSCTKHPCGLCSVFTVPCP